MEVSKAKAAKAPKYPTRLQLLEDPALLERHIPLPWRTNAQIAGLLAFLFLSNGCSASSGKAKPAAVAPLFNYGEGRGSLGCVVVNPPSFMPEDEAMQVISEELAKAGVDTTKRSIPLKNFIITERRVNYGTDSERTPFINGPERNLFVADIFDEKKRIVAEFISESNFFKRGGPSANYLIIDSTGGNSFWCSVQDYNLKETAQYLASELKKQSKGVIKFGIFYDPLPNLAESTACPNFKDGISEAEKKKIRFTFEKDYAEFRKTHNNYPPLFPSTENMDEASKKAAERKWRENYEAWSYMMEKRNIEESKKLLRAQVRDFVEWLKAQGAI